MKFSTKTRYALRILLQIAESKDKKYVQGKEIAEKQNITEPYMEQIMIPLKSARLIKTARGCFGGYALIRAPKDIKLIEIIELFEGPLYLADCIEDERSCKMMKKCKAHIIWSKISKQIENIFEKITLQNVIDSKLN